MTRSHDTPKTMTAKTIWYAILSATGHLHNGLSNNPLSNASAAGKYRLTILFGFRSMLNLLIGHYT
jgi:hypothetical protein